MKKIRKEQKRYGKSELYLRSNWSHFLNFMVNGYFGNFDDRETFL